VELISNKHLSSISCMKCRYVGGKYTHFMTVNTHQMQKHKFGITCPSALFKETIPGPPDEKIVCQHFTPERTGMHYVTCTYIPQHAKTQVRCNMSCRAFYGKWTGPTRA
jgi:hypothetical protein